MAKGLSDNLITLLAEADKRNGLPNGTMYSIMQQESGGQAKFLDDPSAYHYPANAEGKRIAGHTGKVSTAFGPFGILESTAANPGYGVAPLKDKSFEEQLRFASDYLVARSKQAGGLQAGVAAYGEGDKYGKQVMARIPGAAPITQEAPVTVAKVAPSVPVTQNQAAAPQVQDAPVQVAQAPQRVISESDLVDPNMGWNGMSQVLAQATLPNATIPTASLNFGAEQVQRPIPQPNFASFGSWGKKRG